MFTFSQKKKTENLIMAVYNLINEMRCIKMLTIVGYEFVSFTNKQNGELVEFYKVSLAGKSSSSKSAGIQCEVVNIGKDKFIQNNYKTLFDEKTPVEILYNKFGKIDRLLPCPTPGTGL